MANENFYLTTTLPYVNASPHIGFALEITEADVIARYQRLLGNHVFFNTGTDEHGQKIYQKAISQEIEPQAYCDDWAAQFADLKQQLNLSYDNFIRTTDPHHQTAAQHFWEKSLANGDIYQAQYEIKYCVGCELEKTEKELENGKCPLHPDQELELREEENYFFKFSKYQQPLLKFYRNNPEFVKPAGKMKEVIAFVEQGLKDFSISRLKTKMPWGIPVPNDPNQVMYVWFDALINYISTLGWPDKDSQYDQYWPGIQLAGKDNLRQQAAMWQAMLMSVKLPNSKKILINGFINVDGQKMSKSLGNVISPQEMVARYGIDGTRYLLISLGSFNEDTDVSWRKFDERYTADLANGLGNLCSRVAKMAANENLTYTTKKIKMSSLLKQHLDSYDLSAGLKEIINFISLADGFLSKQQPWKKQGQEKNEILTTVIDKIHEIAFDLQPFMPSTAAKIQAHFQDQIQPLTPMFPRLI